MGSELYGGEDWLLEYLPKSGQDSVTVNVPEEHDTELDVPEAFLDAVDTSYYETMKDKVERLTREGKTVLLERDDTLDAVEPGKMDAYGPATWGEERPRLLTVDQGVEASRANADPVLWDGDTIVPVFSETDEGLTIDLVAGSYAERAAVPDHVDRFPVDRLPASMNSTLLPIVEHDGETGIVAFERGAGAGEYPDRYIAIAGGAPTMMHPADVAWLEAREEARILPDYAPNELRERSIVEDGEKLASGAVDDTAAYFLNEDDGVGTYLQVPHDAIDFLGIVRDTDGTYAPEAIYAVDTGLPFGGTDSDQFGVADMYRIGEEHTDITFVPLDDMEEAHDYVPTTAAAITLFNIRRGETTLEAYEREAPEAYPDAETTSI